MGSNTKRTFEENVEMIADSLAQIAVGQMELLAYAKRNSDYICRCDRGEDAPPETPTAPAETGKTETPDAPAEAAAPEPPTGPAVSYEQLKFALLQRGVEVKKGTKMTTLLKLWDEHKFDELIPAANTTAGVAESAARAAEDVPPETETPDPGVGDDIFDDASQTAAAPAPTPMTRERAVNEVSALFSDPPSAADRQLMASALKQFGVAHFRDLADDKLADFVATVRRLTGDNGVEGR